MTATLRDPMAMFRQREADRDEADAEAGRASGRHRRPVRPTTEADAAWPTGEPPVRIARSSTADLGAARRGGPSFAASFVDILPVLPTIGAIATVFAYIGGPSTVPELMRLCPLLTGAAAAVTVGLTMAACHRPFFTAPDQAHPQSFAELRQRLDSLTSQLRVMENSAAASATPTQMVALNEATSHQRALERDLARGGPQWIIGTGYVDATTRLHRAEEALILVQPVEDVVAGALFDELRIAGSTMPERDRLLGKLRAAVQALSPSVAAYLNDGAPAPGGQPATGQPATAQDGQPVGLLEMRAESTSSTQPTASTPGTTRATEARIVVREVRRAVNDFRDECRARLIRSRCRLLGTMTVTGIITYVLLAFAVAMSTGRTMLSSDPIAAAAAIYLVGAVVGLFNRLYVESGDDAAYEEYGLSKTRLLLTPMLSGLAAVGGVMIVGMLSGIVDVNAVTPRLAADAAMASGALDPMPGAGVRAAVLSLGDIFSLEQYPFGLVLAAVFGLMPKTFLERLQQASEQSRLDLKSTTSTR